MGVGLVLSGGGTRGIAHLGVLKALEELGITVSVISGCSSGAIAGALYAYGYTPDEILTIVKDIRVSRIIRPALTRTGLLKMEVTEALYTQYLPENSFEKLKIPLIVTATDLQAGRIEHFSSGDLIRPIMASSSIPVVFNPVRINQRYYVDGGLLNNLPAGILEDRCDKIVASHCNPVDENFELTNIKSMVERTFLLIINANAQQEMDLCDLVIEPPGLKKYKVFAFSKADDIFRIGYEHTLQIGDKLLALQHKQ